MKGELNKDQGLLFPIPTASERAKAELRPGDDSAISLISQHLHQIVAQEHIAGIAHFGDLGLKIETFIDRVQAIIKKNLPRTASATETARFVAKLHLRDLYLATACAKESLGFPGNDSSGRPEYSSLAWRTLEKVYGRFIRDLTRFLSREHHVAQDIADSLLADLFMPDRTGNSRIQSYDGRSSLSTWLRVILINRMTNARRAKSYSQTDLIEANTPEKPAVISIDRIVRAKRYGSYLADAVREAGCKLGSQERLLLLWRYEDGLQLQQIARLLSNAVVAGYAIHHKNSQPDCPDV